MTPLATLAPPPTAPLALATRPSSPSAEPPRAGRAPGLRRAALPRCEPPYDDEARGQDHHPAAPRLPLDFGEPARPHLARPLRLVPAPPESPGGRDLDPEDDLPRTPRAELPDPRPWAGRLVQVLVEVLAGERPASQVLRHVSLPVYTDLVATPPRVPSGRARPATAPQVTSLRVSEPADGVAEVCAVTRRAGRYRAVALRLEGQGGRWRCTALQVG